MYTYAYTYVYLCLYLFILMLILMYTYAYTMYTNLNFLQKNCPFKMDKKFKNFNQKKFFGEKCEIF